MKKNKIILFILLILIIVFTYITPSYCTNKSWNSTLLDINFTVSDFISNYDYFIMESFQKGKFDYYNWGIFIIKDKSKSYIETIDNGNKIVRFGENGAYFKGGYYGATKDSSGDISSISAVSSINQILSLTSFDTFGFANSSFEITKEHGAVLFSTFNIKDNDGKIVIPANTDTKIDGTIKPDNPGNDDPDDFITNILNDDSLIDDITDGDPWSNKINSDDNKDIDSLPKKVVNGFKNIVKIFDFINNIKKAIIDIYKSILNADTAPKFEIPIKHKYFNSNKVVIVDLSWYATYKETGDNIICMFAYLGFIWYCFKHASSLISGSQSSSEQYTKIDE